MALGAASLLLKRRKAPGLTGVGLAALATLMGGSAVEVPPREILVVADLTQYGMHRLFHRVP